MELGLARPMRKLLPRWFGRGAAANRYARIIVLMPPAIGAHVITAARCVRNRVAIIISCYNTEIIGGLSEIDSRTNSR
jgi:hypothetical protein